MDAWVEALCSGRKLPSSLTTRLQRLDLYARNLAPQPAEGDRQTHEYGPVGAAHEPDAFVTLLRDPLRLLVNAEPTTAPVIAFRLWRVAEDLRAAGRWKLLPEADSTAIDLVVDRLESLRVLAAERAALGSSWNGLCARSVTAPAKDRVEFTLGYALESAQQRVERLRRRLEARLQGEGFRAHAELVDEGDGPAAVWPPGRLVLDVDLASAQEWPRLLDVALVARSELVDEYRAVTLLVSVAGRLSRCLSGEVAKAWWPRRDAPTGLGRTVADEPRGDAWSNGMAAAGRMRSVGRWAALAVPAGPMVELIASARGTIERDLNDARSRLLALGAERAARILEDLAACQSPDRALRSLANETALVLADLDLG